MKDTGGERGARDTETVKDTRGERGSDSEGYWRGGARDSEGYWRRGGARDRQSEGYWRRGGERQRRILEERKGRETQTVKDTGGGGRETYLS